MGTGRTRAEYLRLYRACGFLRADDRRTYRQRVRENEIRKIKRTPDRFCYAPQKLDKLLEVHIFMKERKRTNKKYSPEFKISVILYMRNNHLSYHETIRKYWGNDVYEQNYIKQVQRWERKYLEEGIAGLEKENRGHPTANGKKRGRPPKLDKQVKEDLIAENQRLRMEIEYLKKLSALVLAEEQKNGKRRS